MLLGLRLVFPGVPTVFPEVVLVAVLAVLAALIMPLGTIRLRIIDRQSNKDALVRSNVRAGPRSDMPPIQAAFGGAFLQQLDCTS